MPPLIAPETNIDAGAIARPLLLTMLLPLVAMLEFSTRGIGGGRSIAPWLAIGANDDLLQAIDRFELQRGTAVGSGILMSLKT